MMTTRLPIDWEIIGDEDDPKIFHVVEKTDIGVFGSREAAEKFVNHREVASRFPTVLPRSQLDSPEANDV